MYPKNNDNAAGKKPSLRVEILISDILKYGVLLSLALMFAGTALCFFDGGDYGTGGGSTEDFRRLISPEGIASFSWREMIAGVFELRGAPFILLGLILLILTPPARVVASIIAYAIERDWRYVAITGTVFLLLALSLLLGKAG